MTTTWDHWTDHAKRFQHMGSPLRPVVEDVRAMEAEVDAAARAHAGAGGMQALVLGMTPEVVAMNWPAGTRVLAVDRNRAMIEAMRREGADRAAVVCGDWRTLPLADGAVDVVAGDGCYILLDYPEGQQVVSAQVRRVLRPGGRFVIRHFVRPDEPEDPARVFADLEARRIGSFHVFKWRLAMALHGNLEQGVCLSEMWNTWAERGPGVAALATAMNWPTEAVATIDHYRDVPTHYHFPTLSEARAGFAGCFEEIACHLPAYELGERCPTFVLRRR